MKTGTVFFALACCLSLSACVKPESLAPDKQFDLAMAYAEKGNYEKARQLAHWATQQGHLDAQVLLGNLLYEANKAEAFRLWQHAAEQGHVIAQHNLGIFAYYRHDYEEARYWSSQAAEQNHGAAQYLMSLLYQSGQGVPVDFDKAVYWLKRSADQGYTDAVHQLRSMQNQGLL